MKIFEIVERYSLINKLIKEERTGTAKEFAKKIGVSRSQLYNYLDYLKSYEIEIHYDLHKKSFVYEENIDIEIQQPIRILRHNELISIDAGRKYLRESKEIGLFDTYLSASFNSFLAKSIIVDY